MQEKLKRTRKKRKKGDNYFNDDTQAAIVAFQKEEDLERRKQIYVDGIQEAFAKLVENVMFVYKFHTLGNIDILKSDCASHLFENLMKYDETKGHKAFSYFNVVAKNWYVQQVKGHKKRGNKEVAFDKDLMAKLESNNDKSMTYSYDEPLIKNEFIALLKEEVKKWRGKFSKDQERRVLEAVIILLSNPDVIPLYNKKSIYLYIREMTGLNTKQVVTNLSKLRRKYGIFKKMYFDGEV